MARDLNGTTDVINCGSGASTDAQNTFTYCAWVAPDSGGEENKGRIIGKGPFRKEFNIDNATVNRGLQLFVDRASADALAISSGDVFGAAFDGTYRFVACTFDTTDGPRLYYATPGALLAEEATYNTRTVGGGGVVNDAAEDLAIGNRPNGTLAFDGRIAEARAWNVRLTLAELRAAMRGFAVRPGALIGHWPLYGVSSPEPDIGPSENHGVLTGTARADHPPGISAYGLASRGRVQKVVTAAASITPDMWHPGPNQPYRELPGVVGY